MDILFYSLMATLAVSVISFVGILSLALKDALLHKIIFYLVAISAGSLMSGFIFVNAAQNAIPALVGLTAGGFIYIAASDLIPELHKETKFAKSLIAFFCFFAGVSLMFFLKLGHGH